CTCDGTGQLARPVPAAAPAPRAAGAHGLPARAPLPSVLTRPLGLAGWAGLEPVVLAALASGDPMLLVGRHGTAKSFLLERLAQALGLEYRFYNASSVNYDDLVGVPVPDASGQALRYISTPSAIWGAQVVFVDEISRCRPDLANKLFPIVHERRVQGILLESLRYRWAAMNPPPDEEALEAQADDYVGAEPLDPALADRFAYLIEVPGWEAFTDAERREVLLDQFRGRHPFAVDVPVLVAQAESVFALLQRAVPARLTEYFLVLADARCGRGGSAYSTRRLTLLLRSALAIQAARVVLARQADPAALPEDVDWEASLWLAVRHGDPALARRGTLDQAALLALHRQAWKASGLATDNPWRMLLATPDPLERALRAIDLPGFGPDELTPLVLDGLASQPDEGLRTASALALYLALQHDGRLHATAFETLARDVRRVLVPGARTSKLLPPHLQLGKEVESVLAGLDAPSATPARPCHAYTRNLLEALLPHEGEPAPHYGKAHPAAVRDWFWDLWQRLRLDTRLQPGASR
ncbi:MAG: AAA family ATPase, partial [Planctomycetia bacterium]